MDRQGRKKTRQPTSNRSKSAPARVPTGPHQATYQILPTLPSEMRSQLFRVARETGAARVPHREAGTGARRPMRPAGPTGGVTGQDSPLTRRYNSDYSEVYYSRQADGSIRADPPRAVGRVVEGTPRNPVEKPRGRNKTRQPASNRKRAPNRNEPKARSKKK